MPEPCPQPPSPAVAPPPDAPSAYVKPVEREGETAYAVFTADGSFVGVAPTRGLALYAARRAGLDPVDAH